MTLFYSNFEALFLAALTVFLAGLLMPGRRVWLWLLLPAGLLLLAGVVALAGLVPGSDFFISHVVRGYASPVGWFFTGTGLLLLVLARATGDG